MTLRINLALQGGGAHGAFTWGVLDRLLEEDDLEIAAISGTSAGAMNGAALKSGFLAGGHAGARETLDWLWQKIGATGADGISDWMQAWLPDPGYVSRALEYAPGFVWSDMLGRMMSPYGWGPLYRNPLTPIVEKFDFGRVCAQDGPALFVCATQVRDGKIRVFSGERITTQAIVASACLPTLFQAVEVEDPETGNTEAFWDGGYTGNPALFPLFEPELPQDIVVVNINPLHRDQLPRTPTEIQNRINEISFNSSLLRELRAIDFVQRLLDEGKMEEGVMKRPLIHMIADDGLMNDLSVATKTVAVPSVIAQLKASGRRAAGAFLRDHKAQIGVTQSANLRTMFE
ncbi:MAG: patatin-like phospholipase family protein [Salibaculum sp.]|uniref:patatin-like phospholipase family protein n=1 Tax=Salibaculum sp. TaxID=2855480 RepID=UPI00287093FD|nr:patatin-like phospholipase family protein [Salibaculum sp.]MDR9427175.1 patatin-like phospholipase family protein [Salibaculum sp.]MDR9482258.1 patatin-like phospholipase family protein [Salibaculum sp.]